MIEQEPELLVSVSMRFPAIVDPYALSALLAPVVRAAVQAGGMTTNISVQPYPLPASLSADREANNGSPGSVAPHVRPPALGSDQP